MAIGLVCGLVALVGCLLALEAAAEDGQWHPHHHGNHSDDPFWTTTDWPTDFPPRAQLRGMVATARPLAMQEKMGLLHLGNAGEDKTTTTPIAAAAAGEDVLEEEVGNSKAPCRFANAAEKFKEMMHAGHHSIMLKWGHQEHDHEHRDREEESHHWHPFGHHSHDHEHDHEHHFKFLNMLGHHHDHEHDHEEKFENPKAAFKFKKLWGAKEADELYE
jgi:hypothetical protein